MGGFDSGASLQLFNSTISGNDTGISGEFGESIVVAHSTITGNAEFGLVGSNAALIAVGMGASVTVVDRSLDALRRASGEELEAVPGVGPKMAEQIEAFFGDHRNREIVDTLLAGQVTLVEPLVALWQFGTFT